MAFNTFFTKTFQTTGRESVSVSKNCDQRRSNWYSTLGDIVEKQHQFKKSEKKILVFEFILYEFFGQVHLDNQLNGQARSV